MTAPASNVRCNGREMGSFARLAVGGSRHSLPTDRKLNDPPRDDLNSALRRLIDDLVADQSTALESFQTWCFSHQDDVQIRVFYGG